jgi:hypothetical protein
VPQLLIKATGAFQESIYNVIQAMALTKITEIQNLIYVGYVLAMIQNAGVGRRPIDTEVSNIFIL